MKDIPLRAKLGANEKAPAKPIIERVKFSDITLLLF